MWELLSEFFLICHYSLVFSLTLLCTVFFVRTRDRIVLRLLLILCPLFVYSLAALFYYLFSADFERLSYRAGSAVSLFMLVLTTLTVPLLLQATSTYMLSLLELPERNRKIGRSLITVVAVIIFFFGLYIIVFLNSSDWHAGFTKALNELFLYGSLFQLLSAVTAAVFLKRTEDLKHRQLLRGIIISFSSIGAFAVLDILFLRDSAYKLVYISYSIFAVLVYLYTAKHYVNRYEPERFDAAGPSAGFAAIPEISEREKQLIPFLIEGRSNREIAESLYISQNTVKTHIRNIYRKAGVSNRLQLMSRLRNHPEG